MRYRTVQWSVSAQADGLDAQEIHAACTAHAEPGIFAQARRKLVPSSAEAGVVVNASETHRTSTSVVLSAWSVRW